MIPWLKSLAGLIGRYAANDDPKTAMANKIALVIAGNQPFYPLYVYAVVGSHALPTLLTWISFPAFFAVPAVGRRNTLAGRMLLCLAGLMNTSLSSWMMGSVSGIDLFYLPSLVIAVMLFGRKERVISAVLTIVTAAIYIIFDRVVAIPHLFSMGNAQALTEMNRFSVLALTAFMLLLWARTPRSASSIIAYPKINPPS